MNKRIPSIVLGTTLALAVVTPALAVRDVQMTAACGHAVIHNATARWGITIFSSTFSRPDQHITFRTSGDLVIALPVGGYEYQFNAPNGSARRSGSFVVGC